MGFLLNSTDSIECFKTRIFCIIFYIFCAPREISFDLKHSIITLKRGKILRRIAVSETGDDREMRG